MDIYLLPDVYNAVLGLFTGGIVYGFGITTVATLLTYGIFKAFSLLNMKN